MIERFKIEVVRLAEVLSLLDRDQHVGKREAAQFLGLSVRTIVGLLNEIPHFRVGAKVLFRKAELVEWMNGHRERTTAAVLDRIADEAVRAVLG